MLPAFCENLGVDYRSLGELRPAPGHARKHNAEQIRQIALSIQQFGFTNPVLVDEEGRILADHGRVKAALQLGMELVPTIRLNLLSEADKRAYALADNKIALNAGWDQKLLVKELHYIQELQIDYDLTVTGFSTAEIDLLFEADAVPP